MAGDYEIIQAVHIGDREIVVGENQADEQGLPYLVAYYESNAILGRYYDAIGSDDFTEIYYRKLIIFLEVLKCRQSLMFQGFPAFLVTEDVLKSP